MMKRILTICLVLLMIAALAAGCKKNAPAPEAGGTADAGTDAPAVETTDIVRLESIDYDEATKGLVLNLTKGTITGTDTEYEIAYGESVNLPLAADAAIEFPMADDLTKTVTITADELTGEFLAFVEEFDDKPLFTMEQEGDAVKTLTYMYLP